MIQIYQKLYSIIFKSPELRKMALLHYTDTNINMSSIGTPETAFYSVFYLAHDIMTYLWQLYPRFGPCIFWVCSCQFETGAV